MGIEDVELTYSTDDFENWTVQKLFNQYVQPLIVEKNPHAPKEHITQILDAKWKEFAIMNPYIPKGEEGILFIYSHMHMHAFVLNFAILIFLCTIEDLPDDEEEGSTMAPPSSGAVEDEPEPEEPEAQVTVANPVAPSAPVIPRRASSRQLRAAAAVATASVTGGAAPLVVEGPVESEEISQSSPASSSAAATPASSQAAPLRIKISKKKKRKSTTDRGGSGRRGDVSTCRSHLYICLLINDAALFHCSEYSTGRR